MFGALRFFLALMVAADHSGIMNGYGVGVMGVVVFYLLSGYVMTHSFLRNFEGKLQNIFRFYKDRILRIYPVYLFFIVLTLIFLFITNYGKPEYDFLAIMGNFLIIPLNFINIPEVNIVLKEANRALIPPAWSLGAEFQFYLLIPFLLVFKRAFYYVIPISLVIFLMSTIGLIDTDLFGYRLLPGVLFIFLCGSIFYKLKHQINEKLEKYYFVSVAIILTCAMIILSFTKNISLGYTVEVFFGFIFGIVAIHLLASAKVESEIKKIDNLLGSLSYPLFLSHYLIIFLFRFLEGTYQIKFEQEGKTFLVIFGAIILSYISYKLVDDPFQKMRKRIQKAK